jgi:hypothetical protein
MPRPRSARCECAVGVAARSWTLISLLHESVDEQERGGRHDCGARAKRANVKGTRTARVVTARKVRLGNEGAVLLIASISSELPDEVEI